MLSPTLRTADDAINQKIFEKSVDLLLVVDRHGTFLRVSPSCLEILGYEPADMVGHVATDFLYPPDLENTKEMMRQSRRGNVVRHFDCRYVHKSGNVIVLAWVGQWSEEEQQHFFIGRDITQIRIAKQHRRIRSRQRSILLRA